MKIGVIDYGMGNLRSVEAAVAHFQHEAAVSADAGVLATCERLILPGVGSFFAAMTNIRERGLDALIKSRVAAGTPLLGICLGMQLLATTGTEDGVCDGLGLIEATVRRFPDFVGGRKVLVPHIGFNTVDFGSERADFYFVHSFRMECVNEADVIGWCEHGERFAAVVQRGAVFGTQFHPEKSQSNGLKLFRNFVDHGSIVAGQIVAKAC